MCALWLPLAISFELMLLEGPTVQAAMGRLPDPKLNLAAWGLTISLSLLIESPVIMLLATAIALVYDSDSYRALRRFMLNIAVGCTLLTAVIAFTPLFDIVAGRLMGQPAPIVQASRPALQIMLLWSAAIAWRRFYQGIMVHFAQTRLVSWGTAIRLVVTIAVAASFALSQHLPGVQVGAISLMAGVISEALATTFFAWPTVQKELGKVLGIEGIRGYSRVLGVGDPEAHATTSSPTTTSTPQSPVPTNTYEYPRIPPIPTNTLNTHEYPPPLPLSQQAIWRFHAPLAATTLLTLLAQPMTAAALARLPEQVATLAVWPVVSMFLLVMRGWGLALQEITVSQAKNPATRPALKRFTWMVGLITTGATALIAFTPLLDLYMGQVLHLPVELYGYAHIGVGVGMLLPLISSLSSWAGGLLVASGQTHHRYRGMAINLGTHASLLGLGVLFQLPGMWVAAVAFTVAAIAEYIYLARMITH